MAGVPAVPAKGWVLGLDLCSGLVCLSRCGRPHAMASSRAHLQEVNQLELVSLPGAKALLCVAPLGQQFS